MRVEVLRQEAMRKEISRRAQESRLGVGSAGQSDLPLGRFGMLPVEKRGMTHGADADTTALVSDLRAEHGTFVPLGAEKTEFHQFMRTQEFLQLGEDRRREAAFSEFQCGLECLAEAA